MAVVVKNLPPNAGGLRDTGLIPGSGGSPEGEHVQCSCLENPHGQRSLAGYSPWGHKESAVTEQLTLSLSFPGPGHSQQMLGNTG